MPAPLQFFDMEVNLPAAQTVKQPVPVTTGVNWQPNDIRLFYQLWFQPLWNYQMHVTAAGSGSSTVSVSGSSSGSFNGSVSGTSCSGSYHGSASGSGGSSFYWNGSNNTSTQHPGPNNLIEPLGYSTLGNILPTDNYQALGYSISWRRLIPGDTNTFVTYQLPEAMNVFSTMLLTVRGVDPAWDPGSAAGADWGFLSFPNASNINIANSVSVPGPGTLICLCTSYPAPQVTTSNPPWVTAQYTGFSISAPTGWTNLVATSSSGSTFYPYYANSSAIAVAKSYASATTTGSILFPAGPSANPAMDGIYVWLKPAPDVVATTGNATTTTTATAATYSSSTTVRATAGSASTTSSASTAFNLVLGYWISDPLALTGAPVTGSIVRWNPVTPPGSTVTVETSINNGTSWDVATNNQPIPRLREGDTATQNVRAKITFSRVAPPSLYPGPGVSLFPSETIWPSTSSVYPAASAYDLQPVIFPGANLFPTGSPPKVTFFELAVSSDASVDELVPIAHGMIDKVTVHATSGTTGGGSSTNVVGSTGVVSRGGGQTGGGVALKIHVNDMSYAIKRNVWQMPYTIPSGLLYTDAIKAMVLNRLPDQTAFNLSSTTRTTPVLVYGVQQGGDPWQDIMELAQAIGYEAYFDASGTFVCRPVPDPRLGDPVWEFDELVTPLVAEAQRELSSDQTFNDIVVIGQSTSTSNPFSAEAYDDNPISPTYVLGQYGRVSQRLTFSLITSQDQAQDVANATLYNSLGTADTVTLTVVPHPALEPGDIIKVNCSNIKANGTYMINSMTTPLSPADPQILTCFRQSTLGTLGSNQSSPGGVVTPVGPPVGTIVTENFFQSSGVSHSILGSYSTVTSAVGNCLVVWTASVTDGSSHYTGLSGGGVGSWTRIASQVSVTVGTDIWNLSMWFGKVTNPGFNTLSLTTSGSYNADFYSWIGAQEFALVGGGAATVWGLDGTQQGTRTGSASPILYPTLTPSGTNRLYVGGQIAVGTPLGTGQTAGYTLNTAAYPMLTGALFNTPIANSAQSPSTTQGTGSFSNQNYATLAGIILAH